jgi:hypothetical protein
MKGETLVSVKENLLSQSLKIPPAKRFLKNHPIEGTVRTKLLAKRYVNIKDTGGIHLSWGNVQFPPLREFHGPAKFPPRFASDYEIDKRIDQNVYPSFNTIEHRKSWGNSPHSPAGPEAGER